MDYGPNRNVIKDMHLAAFLHCLGFHYIVAPVEGPSRSLVGFEFREASQDIALAFFNQPLSLTVDGVSYSFTVQQLFRSFRDIRHVIDVQRGPQP